MQKLVYLDNAATTFPKPEAIYKFMDSWYRGYGVNPGRSGYDLSLETGNFLEQTRGLLTSFFNGTDPNRLIFTYNASDSLNLAISGTVRRGDHVITTNLEHNSVLRPLHHAANDLDVRVDHVPFDKNGYVDPQDIKRLIGEKTRLVVCNHGSNVLGTVQPIAEIGRICHEKGVLFAVDSAQTAGIIPIDVQAMNIDLLAFTGHKSLLGPTGIGGLYVTEGVTVKMTKFGGTGVRSAHKFHLPEYPYRLEVGTVNVLGVAGLHAGQKFIAEEGLDNIYKREMALYHRLREGFAKIPGLTHHCPNNDANQLPVIAFEIDGFEALDVGTIADVDFGIASRTGLHCAPRVHEQLGTADIGGTVRFSIGPLNTESDIDRAIEAATEIADQGKRRAKKAE